MKKDGLNKADAEVLEKILGKRPYELTAQDHKILLARKPYLTPTEIKKYGLAKINGGQGNPDPKSEEESEPKQD